MDLLCFCSVLCLLCLCARLFICALWSPAGKGLTSWLSFVVSTVIFCHFPIGILGQAWYLIVSIPDLCTLTYFVVCVCFFQILSEMVITYICRFNPFCNMTFYNQYLKCDWVSNYKRAWHGLDMLQQSMPLVFLSGDHGLSRWLVKW